MTGVGLETSNANSRAGALTPSNARRRARQQRFVKHMRWKWRIEHRLDKLGVPEGLDWQIGPIRQAYGQAELFVPAHDGVSLPSSLLSLSQQYEQIHWTLERSLGMFRRILAGLTSPPPLRTLRLEARIAWDRFDKGDPEPLDRFIKRRLGVMKNHDGPLPDDVRQGVMDFLGDCLASVPLYEPGEWFLLRPPQIDQLATLIGKNIKAYPRLRVALQSDDEKFRERLAEELPGIVRVAWDDLDTISDEHTLNEEKPLLTQVSKAISDMGPRNSVLLADEMADEATNDSLARFEASEAARQELDLMEQGAALSPQQAEVWTLARQGAEIGEIANILGKTPNHISVQKHNAVRAMKQAHEAGAA